MRLFLLILLFLLLSCSKEPVDLPLGASCEGKGNTAWCGDAKVGDTVELLGAKKVCCSDCQPRDDCGFDNVPESDYFSGIESVSPPCRPYEHQSFDETDERCRCWRDNTARSDEMTGEHPCDGKKIGEKCEEGGCTWRTGACACTSDKVSYLMRPSVAQDEPTPIPSPTPTPSPTPSGTSCKDNIELLKEQSVFPDEFGIELGAITDLRTEPDDEFPAYFISEEDEEKIRISTRIKHQGDCDELPEDECSPFDFFEQTSQLPDGLCEVSISFNRRLFPDDREARISDGFLSIVGSPSETTIYSMGWLGLTTGHASPFTMFMGSILGEGGIWYYGEDEIFAIDSIAFVPLGDDISILIHFGTLDIYQVLPCDYLQRNHNSCIKGEAKNPRLIRA